MSILKLDKPFYVDAEISTVWQEYSRRALAGLGLIATGAGLAFGVLAISEQTEAREHLSDATSQVGMPPYTVIDDSARRETATGERGSIDGLGAFDNILQNFLITPQEVHTLNFNLQGKFGVGQPADVLSSVERASGAAERSFNHATLGTILTSAGLGTATLINSSRNNKSRE